MKRTQKLRLRELMPVLSNWDSVVIDSYYELNGVYKDLSNKEKEIIQDLEVLDIDVSYRDRHYTMILQVKYDEKVNERLEALNNLPELTDDEKVILKNITTYTHIGRGKNENLRVLSSHPDDIVSFYENDELQDFSIYNHMFESIKGGEIYKISDLLD